MFRKKQYRSRSASLTEDAKVSFCIPHRNRFSFLEQTLRKNLDQNDPHLCEFVLVDFGSEENVTDWIKTEFAHELGAGYLTCFEARGLGDWHASIAKNTVHLQASGDILVNLDCDNFTGTDGAKFVRDQFLNTEDEIVFWQYSKKKLDGTFGRIGMTRRLFHELGGYDQNLLQMGYQDGDLKDRAMALGAKLVHDRSNQYNGAIKNDKFVPKEMSWKQMNEQNERTSANNIRAGKLVANKGKRIGLEEVLQIF